MNHALWYASRATGVVSLLLLTASMVLGLMGAGRFTSRRWPRFTVSLLHRNVSLLALLFLAVHIVSAIVDPYAGIGWLDAVVPFMSAYHPLSLGLGAVAFDLMLAIIATSVLRTRISLKVWRWVHLTAYLCWPVAVVHGLAIGGHDSHLQWLIGLVALSIAAVIVALVWSQLRVDADTMTRQHKPNSGARR